jgi:hypothetical protein
MTFLFAISAHTGIRLAEVGFLLLVIAGVWLVASQLQVLKFERLRIIVAGILIAASGVLLVIATHWGRFG